MPTQTLQIKGSYGATLAIQFNEIVRDFGDGADNTALVGNSAGLKLYSLKYDFLPDDGGLTVTDPENSNAVTSWPQYLWKFFVRRKADGAAFNLVITNPATSTDETVLVKFVDSALSYEWLTYKLFSSGVQLRQYRAAS